MWHLASEVTLLLQGDFALHLVLSPCLPEYAGMLPELHCTQKGHPAEGKGAPTAHLANNFC